MARRATSLGPKPSLFVFCCFFVFVFCFVFVFFGGLKGQVRWPKGPPHLALNPPYLFIFVFVFFWFLSLLLIEKPCFPPKKGTFCLFSVFLVLSPSTFLDLPLFLFLFLCLSLALVFLSSFLSFFFAFFLFLVLSLFHFSFFFAFVS